MQQALSRSMETGTCKKLAQHLEALAARRLLEAVCDTLEEGHRVQGIVVVLIDELR